MNVYVMVTLEDTLAEIAGHLNVQHAALVEATARALGTDEWCGAGIHSPAQWLTIQMGLSPTHAKQVVAIASRIGEFPHLRESFGRGELTLDQVYEVATKAPAWADRRVTEFAQSATVRQLRRVMRDEYFEPDPDQPVTDAAPVRDRTSFGWDEHSRFGLHADLSTDDGAIVEAALNEARDALFQSGTTDVSWPDALVEVCQRSLGAASPARRERFKAYIHVDTGSGTAQFTNGVTLPPSVRDYLLCDCSMQPVWERDNIAFGVGRTQRIVPDRTRRIIEHRDQGCRVPGCGATHVEIHHIVAWSTGGVTDTSNLVSLCPRHHKLHHRGLLHITGNADTEDALVFAEASGRQLGRHRRPIAPTGPALGGSFHHPSGERLDARWIDWAHPNARQRRAEYMKQHHERQQRERDFWVEWRRLEYLRYAHPDHPDLRPKPRPPDTAGGP